MHIFILLTQKVRLSRAAMLPLERKREGAAALSP